MQPSARYVTQHQIWACHILGPLTDRRISFYQNRGRIDKVKVKRVKKQVVDWGKFNI